MPNQDSYNEWSEIYDTNVNRTRDLEAKALRSELADLAFDRVLEIGCGTGKNTEWLMTRTQEVVGVDFSTGMLDKARQKINADHVTFVRADVREEWAFIQNPFDLVICSLVLEHVEDLMDFFRKAHAALSEGGYLYIGELHPDKQANGTKARFETHSGVKELDCYLHPLSEFTSAATNAGFVSYQT